MVLLGGWVFLMIYSGVLRMVALARQMSCTAVRDIAAGEELKVDYFYPGPSVPSCLVVSLELSDAKVYEP